MVTFLSGLDYIYGKNHKWLFAYTAMFKEFSVTPIRNVRLNMASPR